MTCANENDEDADCFLGLVDANFCVLLEQLSVRICDSGNGEVYTYMENKLVGCVRLVRWVAACCILSFDCYYYSSSL